MAYVIKFGATGNSVKDMQQKLVELGALDAKDPTGNSNVDGRFGNITLDAVKKFQKTKGLVIDGVVGQDTAQALGLSMPQPSELPKASHLFTQNQLIKLAEVIDSFIPTGPLDPFDDSIIAWLVNKLDGALASLIPPKILSLLHDLSNGIEGHDLNAFKARLTKSINEEINIPLLSEETEGKIIYFVVDLVVESLQVGRSFDNVLSKLRGKSANSNV